MSAKCWKVGYKMTGGLAKATKKGFASSGVATAVHKSIGVEGPYKDAPNWFDLVPGRVSVCIVHSWLPGGVAIINVYLKDGEELGT